MGRDLADINWNEVRVKMEAGCSGEEIAGAIGIHHDTFYARYKKEYKTSFASASQSKRAAGFGNVRTSQYVNALKGNTQMLLRLGEEWLGQGKKGETDGDQTRILISIAERMDALSEKLKSLESSIYQGRIGESAISPEPSLSYQRCAGEKDQIHDELGTRNPMEGET